MPEEFIKLKCQNCGGNLDVYGDMERFACAYCGTEMIVQRRGGTVALKLVQEAIKKVQVGTDKTMAELALVRLNDELKPLITEAFTIRNATGLSKVCLFGCGGFFALGGLGVLLVTTDDTSGGVLLLLVGLGLLVAGRFSSPVNHRLKEVEDKSGDVDRRIAEQRAIVDS
jgi:ribosomal protein S27E